LPLCRRPNRPTLGIDKAPEDISQNKGVLYDPQVVDAYMKFFCKMGFGYFKKTKKMKLTMKIKGMIIDPAGGIMP